MVLSLSNNSIGKKHFYRAHLILFLFLCAIVSCSQGEKVKLKIGDKAPDFTAKTLSGETLSLSRWKGSPVILRFWSTDCKYCRADTPVFNEYFTKYKELGLKMAYVNTGEEAAVVREFVRELAIPFPVVYESGAELAEMYSVQIVPQTIIIDPEQKIIAAILGGVGEPELHELVGSYFK